MGRSRKIRKSSDAGSTTKRKTEEPLKRRYRRFKERGYEDPGDHCPDCGEPTGFQSGFLICQTCGWIDSGSDAIEIDFNAA